MVDTVASFRAHVLSKDTAAIWLQPSIAQQECRLDAARSSDISREDENLDFFLKKCEISQFLNDWQFTENFKKHLCVPDTAHQLETLALDRRFPKSLSLCDPSGLLFLLSTTAPRRAVT